MDISFKQPTEIAIVGSPEIAHERKNRLYSTGEWSLFSAFRARLRLSLAQSIADAVAHNLFVRSADERVTYEQFEKWALFAIERVREIGVFRSPSPTDVPRHEKDFRVAFYKYEKQEAARRKKLDNDSVGSAFDPQALASDKTILAICRKKIQPNKGWGIAKEGIRKGGAVYDERDRKDIEKSQKKVDADFLADVKDEEDRKRIVQSIVNTLDQEGSILLADVNPGYGELLNVGLAIDHQRKERGQRPPSKREEAEWVNSVLLMDPARIPSDTVPSASAVTLLESAQSSPSARNDFQNKFIARFASERDQGRESDRMFDDGSDPRLLFSRFLNDLQREAADVTDGSGLAEIDEAIGEDLALLAEGRDSADPVLSNGSEAEEGKYDLSNSGAERVRAKQGAQE